MFARFVAFSIHKEIRNETYPPNNGYFLDFCCSWFGWFARTNWRSGFSCCLRVLDRFYWFDYSCARSFGQGHLRIHSLANMLLTPRDFAGSFIKASLSFRQMPNKASAGPFSRPRAAVGNWRTNASIKPSSPPMAGSPICPMKRFWRSCWR